MKTPEEWFTQYGESHRHPTNKLIHWICIPLIVLSLLGLLACLPSPFEAGWLHWGTLVSAGALAWYARLSKPLALGMAVVVAAMLLGVAALAALPVPLWVSSLVIFVGAWIGQFIGHEIEGKKPSFFEDLQFLLIGPLWLLGFVYRRAGLRY